MKGEKTRVMIETQSNSLFRGIEMEQDFDQRGGLCQVGDGHVVVTTKPIDSDYLAYWQDLGFTLPRMIVAGPFDRDLTLADLVISKQEVQDEILGSINGRSARLEFFWIEESERYLSSILGIPPYCNFEVSIPFACKYNFKLLCEELGLKTAPWVGGKDPEELLKVTKSFLTGKNGNGFLLKSSRGTGGVDLGGLHQISSYEDLVAKMPTVEGMCSPFIVEQMVKIVDEVCVHWEITEDGKFLDIGIFDQLSTNLSYSGTAFPTRLTREIESRIRTDLETKLVPYLQRSGAKGYFCCDILIDETGNVYWTDFNPRKGAIVFIYEMSKRLAKIRNPGSFGYHFWHEHISTGKSLGFKELFGELKEILVPSTQEPFAVITNPGVLYHGGIDVTGLSINSREEAKAVVKEVRKRLDFV